jgi:hypothetical protein
MNVHIAPVKEVRTSIIFDIITFEFCNWGKKLFYMEFEGKFHFLLLDYCHGIYHIFHYLYMGLTRGVWDFTPDCK